VTQHQVLKIEIVAGGEWQSGLFGKNSIKAAGGVDRSNSNERPGATGPGH
jgi:hypothetical protein